MCIEYRTPLTNAGLDEKEREAVYIAAVGVNFLFPSGSNPLIGSLVVIESNSTSWRWWSPSNMH